MHSIILARRQLDAQNRIVAATAQLADKFEIEPPASVNQRLPDVTQMMRWEAIADFLEALVSSVGAGVATVEAEPEPVEEAEPKPKTKKGKASEQ